MAATKEWSPRVRRAGGEDNERLQYVTSLMREERFDEARDELLEMLHEDEKSIQARMVLGSLYLRQQMHADALDQFRYAIAIEPLAAQPHVLAGTCCVKLHDLEEARALLQTALNLDPKQANAHVGMAQVLSQTGQTEQAIAQLEEALRLDPQLAPARIMMATLLSQSGNVDGAIEELEDFVNTNPEHTAASVRLAVMQAKKANYPKTIELLEAALKANPQSSRLWGLLGRIKVAVKDYAGAERAFSEAMELKTEDRNAPIRLVDVLVKQGKLDRAREILQTLPRRGRMASVVHRYYGEIYAARQLYDDAVESYRAAILHTPDGEKIIEEISAAAGADATSASQIPHFLAAFSKMREQAKQKRDENRASGGGRRGGGAMPGRARAGARASRRIA
jgi:tetratricopeptide (TPR) repeat protein